MLSDPEVHHDPLAFNAVLNRKVPEFGSLIKIVTSGLDRRGRRNRQGGRPNQPYRGLEAPSYGQETDFKKEIDEL